VDTKQTPCQRCPNYRQKLKGPNLLHACEENWYALGGFNTADIEVEALWITNDDLANFWNGTRRRLFSCPYRRGHYVYKVLPLGISSAALILSALGNETVRQAVGLQKERITKVEIVKVPEGRNTALPSPAVAPAPKEAEPKGTAAMPKTTDISPKSGNRN